TGKCDKGKVALIGGLKLVRKDDVAHTKSRQRFEQDVVIGSIPDPRNKSVEPSQNNTISKQNSAQILRLRRDELTVFIGGGNASHPKIVPGRIVATDDKRDRTTKFAARAKADGFAKKVHKLRLVWIRFHEIRRHWAGTARVNRGCCRDRRGDQQRS